MAHNTVISPAAQAAINLFTLGNEDALAVTTIQVGGLGALGGGK